MKEPRKEALRAHREYLRAEVTVTDILQDCRKFLTDDEYLWVHDRSKIDSESAMDELIKVLLTTDDKNVNEFYSILQSNGYAHLVGKLEDWTKEKETVSVNVEPRDQQIPTEVKLAWVENGKPQAESSPAVDWTGQPAQNKGEFLNSWLTHCESIRCIIVPLFVYMVVAS